MYTTVIPVKYSVLSTPLLEMMGSMEFKMDAEKALKLILKNRAERALFISNLGQGESDNP